MSCARVIFSCRRWPGETTPHPPGPLPPQGGKGSNDDAGKAVRDELAQWERFAVNRLERGPRNNERAFEVKAIPDELAFEVSAGLLFARDREAVRGVFAGVGD